MAMENILRSNSLDDMLDCTGSLEVLFENSIRLEDCTSASGDLKAEAKVCLQRLQTGSDRSSDRSCKISSQEKERYTPGPISGPRFIGAPNLMSDVYEQHSRWLNTLQRDLNSAITTTGRSDI